MDFDSIGKRVKKQRKAHAYTQQTLSEMANITEKYLSNIENGRDKCSLQVLVNIANALDISVDYLLGDNLIYNSKAHQEEAVLEKLVKDLKELTLKQQLLVANFVMLLQENNFSE